MDNERFEQELLAYLEEKREAMTRRFHRVLPTGELLFNRYDKAAYLGAGEGTSVYDTSVIMGDVRLGKKVWVGPYTLIEGIHAPVTVGDFVSINTGVQVYSHDSTKHYVSGGKVPVQDRAGDHRRLYGDRQHVDDRLRGDDRLPLRCRRGQYGDAGHPRRPYCRGNAGQADW